MQLIEAKIENPHELWLVWDEEIPFAEVHLPDYTIVKIKEGDDLRTRYIEINETFDLQHPVRVLWQQQELVATTGSIIRTPWFDEQYDYDGPLGNEYSKERTTFRLWAPTAASVELALTLKPNVNGQNFAMQYIEKGVYAVTVEGDCADMFYQYHLTFPNGMEHQTKDPYSLMDEAGYSVVVVPPEKVFETRSEPNNKIFYPVNLRYFLSETSGLPIMLQNTFQGLSTKGTVNQFGDATGLDYLEWLRPTHLLLENAIENEAGSPLNAHQPNPSCLFAKTTTEKIEEVRGTIEQLHRRKFNVMLVLNLSHVATPATHPLHLTVPGYYFRYDEEGVIVDRLNKGSELASERKMVRRYLCHILQTWLELYQVDGFYLQHMTTFDEATVLEIEQLTKKDGTPAVIVASGNDSVIPETVERSYASLYPKIEWSNPSFAQSLLQLAQATEHSEERVANQLLGGLADTATFVSPKQVVQNLETVTNLPMMAIALLLVSQGNLLLPSINQPVDWNFGKMHSMEATAVAEWLQYRLQEPLFNLDSYEAIHQQSQLLYCQNQTLAIALSNEEKTLIIVANVGEEEAHIDLPTGNYFMRSHDYHIELYPSQLMLTHQLSISPNQLLILERH